MRAVHRLPLLMLVPLLVACSALTGADRVRVLGAIAGYLDGDPQVTIQQDGRTITVLVTTYGGGCHTQGETEVVIDGLMATVTPYDYTATPGTGCTDQLLSFEHRAVVQFPSGGTAQLRIRGIDRRGRSETNMVGDTLVVTRTVAIP